MEAQIRTGWRTWKLGAVVLVVAVACGSGGAATSRTSVGDAIPDAAPAVAGGGHTTSPAEIEGTPEWTAAHDGAWSSGPWFPDTCWWYDCTTETDR
jgi:hypothetical protein